MATEFNIGDVCRVKSLEDMKAEFGDSLASVTFGFNSEMEYLCGQTFTISERFFSTYNNRYRYYSEEKIESKNKTTPWAISADMLELMPLEREMKAASKNDLKKLFCL